MFAANMNVAADPTSRWLDALGYDGTMGVVHRPEAHIPADHPYARELDLLLNRGGEIRSSAVFEIDRVPALCFVDASQTHELDADFVDEVRRRIWNQNLVSIVVVIHDARAIAYPAAKALRAAPPLSLESASTSGPFSSHDVATGEVERRLPAWFDPDNRLDRVLLENLREAVRLLVDVPMSTEQAQLVVGKCIFVSYLEHREIVGQAYRDKHGVGRVLSLLAARDGAGLDKLFSRLKRDFNGDFLEIEGGANVRWRDLPDTALDLLASFLRQDNLSSRQMSLWPYNFRYIPVELLSGIYETFLGEDQRKQGAVYTPRHLALLAVDEAFRGVAEPWKEVVLDGACGSGILLTCAYRRMLGAAAARSGGPLSFLRRKGILMDGIRGSDVSAAACKVTAFSLYLALLEDLAPSDIAQLQDDQNVKLPELIGEIISEDGQGDFFDACNKMAAPSSATVVLSNPPWFEPKGGSSDHAYEDWWSKHVTLDLPRRQIAWAFARRATDALVEGGRLCLILPASVLGAAGSGEHLRDWFRQLSPERIFNLADMRQLLFPGAIHPTAVISGRRRAAQAAGRIPLRETCEYLVPKADVSLAFGRLAIHSADRKRLHVPSMCEDAEVLRTYFWGNVLDEGLIARLRLLGTVDDHARGAGARFTICKGFHKTDNSKAATSSRPLRGYQFLSTERGNSRFPADRVFLQSSDLTAFPDEIKEVADLGSKEGAAFDGVRVIFPDGADMGTLEVRACYTDRPCCFTQTVSAIVDTQGDARLMQFFAAYLRSELARYLLFYTTFSMSMERPHVKLTEIRTLPFVLPEEHPDPKRAASIIGEVTSLLAPFRRRSDLSDDTNWLEARARIDGLICDYFNLSVVERQAVHDTCAHLIPSRQPTTLAAMRTPLHGRPDAADFRRYARVLQSELESWRDRLHGDGYFGIEVSRPPSRASGAMGVVRMSIEDAPTRSQELSSDDLVRRLLANLRGADDYPLVHGEASSVASDFLVRHDGAYYLVKPLIKRLWLAPAAAHDAYRIVQAVRELAPAA